MTDFDNRMDLLRRAMDHRKTVTCNLVGNVSTRVDRAVSNSYTASSIPHNVTH